MPRPPCTPAQTTPKQKEEKEKERFNKKEDSLVSTRSILEVYFLCGCVHLAATAEGLCASPLRCGWIRTHKRCSSHTHPIILDTQEEKGVKWEVALLTPEKRQFQGPRGMGHLRHMDPLGVVPSVTSHPRSVVLKKSCSPPMPPHLEVVCNDRQRRGEA